ncbi:hypothetical protein ZHAS_00008289 [Anopheles sinensis]|uniref:Uncharacterized protein n=1 Tax=Anopheles sinensis TaxID=74873 RepID=A0A084VRS8_ANOSI|nr:hypothetical protein ZHAS_00008289 [Anopheles sinensis]
MQASVTCPRSRQGSLSTGELSDNRITAQSHTANRINSSSPIAGYTNLAKEILRMLCSTKPGGAFERINNMICMPGYVRYQWQVGEELENYE